MLDYRITQLKTILLRKYLNELSAVWEDQWEEHIINRRIYELEKERDGVPECRKLGDEYSKLFDRMRDSADKKQWKDALFELDSLVGSRLFETEKFHYLAGVYDALRIFYV
jgi:hypothetical protein